MDDGSKDSTRDALKELDGKGSVRVILHEHNKGKGVAVRTGMAAALGDVLLIQDADLEYGPRDYSTLLKSIEEGMVLHANSFNLGPEFTAKILKRKFRIFEVPITFNLGITRRERK